jgi:hypothetical protein
MVADTQVLIQKYITPMHLTDDSFTFVGPSKKKSFYCHIFAATRLPFNFKNSISLLSSHTISVCDGLKV